ncbi:hypothetical protein J8F10_36205 [Gemmata sp. G18]|uniref:Uncharacterized protein n=1 Tax=Gemmata palustris TaxID=2822762 RepID=A0ABS5C420_9BACT|nr:hypothetical protein [Gemmata palustris]MBP3960700.1 hypothetical protein [Gemmata palustris]
MLRSLFSLCLAVGLFNSVASAEDPAATVEKAKEAHAEGVNKARNTLLEAFKAANNAAKSSGDLNAVKVIQAEQDTFENSGKLPTSARMKSAVASYQQSMKQARTTLDAAYEQAIKDFTKAGKIAQAEETQSELHDLRAKTVATKENLQAYLANTSWVWGNCRLKANGYVENKGWDSAGLVTKWEAIDRRTVLFSIEKGRDVNRLAVLVFNEELTEFQGIDFNGKDRIPVSKRKP